MLVTIKLLIITQSTSFIKTTQPTRNTINSMTSVSPVVTYKSELYLIYLLITHET